MKKRARKQPARPVAPRRAAGASRSANSLITRIRHNVLFTGVDPNVVARNLKGFGERAYAKGEVVFDEHSRGRELYLISSGRIHIKKYTKFGVESLLAVLHEGDFFGELSLLDGHPRSAEAVALDDCMLISATQQTLRNLIRESEAFTYNLLSNLAIRLRTMDQTFVLELDRNAAAATSQMDKLNMLIEASKIVNSSIDIDKLLGLILGVASRSIGADRGTLYLIDESNREVWSKVAQGPNMVEIRLPIGKGLAGYVAKTGDTVNIADAYKDPRFNPEIDRRSGYTTRNVLCMPMRDKEGSIVGVFQFLNKKEGPFTAEDESFLEGLSLHAAVALENARLVKTMVESERLSAVGRMASTIIHDIKNPMGTLRMYAQVIKKKTGDTEAAQLAEEIIRQVDRFVNMTQEVLDFSRGISELNLELVNVGEMMEGVLNFIATDMSKRQITLERRIEYDGPCMMDVEKMVRAFYNLASNAADAMLHGGTLTVGTRKADGQLLIAFTDTGTGIPDEVRHRMFEPFFTYGKKHGTGLGLAIVKKIMDDHKGIIEVNSELNKGTTIGLLLPLRR